MWIILGIGNHSFTNIRTMDGKAVIGQRNHQPANTTSEVYQFCFFRYLAEVLCNGNEAISIEFDSTF